MNYQVEKLISPVSGSGNVLKIGRLSKKWLMKWYKKIYNVDIAYLFKDIDEISMYKCLDTGYEFYYPFVEGDELFYEKLQVEKKDYYRDWKWENEVILPFIREGSSVLDIGCGAGGFLSNLQNKLSGLTVRGLEFNEKAIEAASQKGIYVTKETVAEHALTYGDNYDVVCSFQVLEHIACVRAFITDCIKLLKPGGLLIFSVPNNDSFQGYYKYDVLNKPPHHAGRWNDQSLKSIADIFNIKFLCTLTQPMSHVPLTPILGVLLHNEFIADILLNKLRLRFLFRSFSEKIAGSIKGHTIVALYVKH